MSWREDIKIGIGRITSLYLGSGLGTLVTSTAAQMNLLLQHVTAGFKVAHGQLNLAATDFGITTGLTTISQAFVSLKGTAAPSNVIAITWAFTAGTLKLYGWKHQSTATPTLVAATSAASVSWEVIGT